jgi:hypothetical protein
MNVLAAGLVSQNPLLIAAIEEYQNHQDKCNQLLDSKAITESDYYAMLEAYSFSRDVDYNKQGWAAVEALVRNLALTTLQRAMEAVTVMLVPPVAIAGSPGKFFSRWICDCPAMSLRLQRSGVGRGELLGKMVVCLGYAQVLGYAASAILDTGLLLVNDFRESRKNGNRNRNATNSLSGSSKYMLVTCVKVWSIVQGKMMAYAGSVVVGAIGAYIFPGVGVRLGLQLGDLASGSLKLP